MDHPAVVHDVNVLTVVASESYKDFVAGLQKVAPGAVVTAIEAKTAATQVSHANTSGG